MGMDSWVHGLAGTNPYPCLSLLVAMYMVTSNHATSLSVPITLPLSIYYASQQTYIKVKILTLREVLMKRHCILKVRLRLKQEAKGLGHNLNELWIHKTDTVIA